MQKPWHLLVYIAADNSLYNDALVSLRQITEASLFSSVRITVQFDGPSADNSVRYSCAGGKRRVIWSPPANYTPDRGQRLRDFLNDVPQEPDRERIFLILWGHGAGLDHVYLYNDPANASSSPANEASSQNGATQDAGYDSEQAAAQHAIAHHIAAYHQAAPQGASTSAAKLDVPRTIPFELLNSDNANANRYLKDIELGAILAEYRDRRLKRPIDVLGFDACLMGLAEICHEVSSSVSLIIASDEELPKGSWPYDSILEDLTKFPGMDASSLSAVIVSRFMERYFKESAHTRISLSAYWLEASPELVRSVRGFVDEVCDNIADQRLRSRVFMARDFARTLEVPDYVDLGVFCNEIIQSFEQGEALRHRAEEIRKVLVESPYILYHRDAGQRGLAAPTGLAVYFPVVLPPAGHEVDTALRAVHHLRSYRPLARFATSGSAEQLHRFRPGNGNQPLPENGMKTPPADRTKSELLFFKRVSSLETKHPPSDTLKHPPSDTLKQINGVRVVQRQLIGSEILWDEYARLLFNRETGWARMVHTLLTYPSVNETTPAFAES